MPPDPGFGGIDFYEVRELDKYEYNLKLGEINRLVDEDNYEEADDILKKGDDLKNRISALRKQQMNRMQEGDNASLKASMVYLNILQESQELVSIWRHLLRASRFFQGDYVPQEVSMIALTEER